MRHRNILAIALTFFSGNALSAGIDELIKPCIGCHGSDGLGSTPKTPHINWQIPGYLSDTMEALQNGNRPTAVPKHIPKTLTGSDLSAIAEFYGKNRAPRPKQTVDSSKLKRGEKIYEDRCLDCHPDDGRESNDRGSPILANQPAEFILAQERLYMSGKRKFSFKADKAHAGLTEADLEAISHYFASQDIQPAPRKKR